MPIEGVREKQTEGYHSAGCRRNSVDVTFRIALECFDRYVRFEGILSLLKLCLMQTRKIRARLLKALLASLVYKQKTPPGELETDYGPAFEESRSIFTAQAPP